MTSIGKLRTWEVL